MPCYDGCREDERRDRETAKKVEAVLCGLISSFGFGRVLERLEFVEIGVTRAWLDRSGDDPRAGEEERAGEAAASRQAEPLELRSKAVIPSETILAARHQSSRRIPSGSKRWFANSPSQPSFCQLAGRAAPEFSMRRPPDDLA